MVRVREEGGGGRGGGGLTSATAVRTGAQSGETQPHRRLVACAHPPRQFSDETENSQTHRHTQTRMIEGRCWCY